MHNPPNLPPVSNISVHQGQCWGSFNPDAVASLTSSRASGFDALDLRLLDMPLDTTILLLDDLAQDFDVLPSGLSI